MEPVLYLLGAGAGGAVVKSVVDHVLRRRRDDFTVLEESFRKEFRRLNAKVDHLEALVLALSEELHAKGGDPLAVRARVTHPSSNHQQPKEQP